MAEPGLSESRLDRALERIDAFNGQDPHGKELDYGRRMSTCLAAFEPDASEALQIAARAQHIGRWTIPRNRYPKDRAGYKAWRTELAAFHAAKTAEILAEIGYGDELIARVKSLLQKKMLKTDAECQTLEDVICLVFLQTEFAAFAPQHPEDKIVHILRRTWIKMSQRGQKAALELEMPPELGVLLEKALGDREK